MSNAIKVAVVTGANKGIGYAVVKDLAKKFDGDVILTGTIYHLITNLTIINKARDTELGLNACKELEKEGVKVKFHQLDIDNQESIETFAKYIKDTYNGLDVLINNAAIAYKVADTTPFSDQATNTIRINFTGTLNLCKALFPLLRPHARVVNVSSRAGMLKIVKDESIRDRLKSDDLTTEELVKILDEFVKYLD
jgi:carbonyl reductase 1